MIVDAMARVLLQASPARHVGVAEEAVAEGHVGPGFDREGEGEDVLCAVLAIGVHGDVRRAFRLSEGELTRRLEGRALAEVDGVAREDEGEMRGRIGQVRRLDGNTAPVVDEEHDDSSCFVGHRANGREDLRERRGLVEGGHEDGDGHGAQHSRHGASAHTTPDAS